MAWSDQFSNKAVIIQSPSVAQASQLLIAENRGRRGLYFYNNGTNSIYVALGVAANSASSMSIIIPTYTTWIMPTPLYTGPIYGIRNAGAGTVLITELT